MDASYRQPLSLLEAFSASSVDALKNFYFLDLKAQLERFNDRTRSTNWLCNLQGGAAFFLVLELDFEENTDN